MVAMTTGVSLFFNNLLIPVLWTSVLLFSGVDFIEGIDRGIFLHNPGYGLYLFSTMFRFIVFSFPNFAGILLVESIISHSNGIRHISCQIPYE